MLCSREALLILLFSGAAAWAQPADVRAAVDSLNRDLRATIRSHVDAGRQDPRFVELLSRRASLVRDAIRQSPRSARGMILRPEELAASKELFAIRDNLLETPASYLSGEEVRVVDSSDWQFSYYVYRLRTGDGEVTAYQDADVGDRPACGKRLRLDGYRLADTMLVTRATLEPGAITPDTACPILGDQRTAVVLVSFPSRPIKNLTVQQYRDTFFSPAAPSVNDFYREQSYGKTSVSGDVFGPFALDRDYDSCTDSSTVETLAFQAADAVADLSQYKRIVVIAPAPVTCGFGGYASVGCYNYKSAAHGAIRVSKVYEFDAAAAEILRVAPHELGHNLGLSHSRSDAFHGEPLGPDRSRSTYSEYGDAYSSMGGGGPYHFAAPHKLMLNWLADGAGVKTIANDQVVDLLPTSSPTEGVHGVRVLRNLNTNEYVWIEYRTPAGYDAALATRLRGGALIHYEDPSTGGYAELLNFGSSFSSAELLAGSAWRDPYSNLTVEALQAAPDRLRMSIRYETPCATVAWRSPAHYLFPAFNVSADVTVQAPCQWSGRANNFWLDTISPAGGTTSATASFAGFENTDATARRGSITVERQTLFLDQDPPFLPLKLRYFGPRQAAATQNAWVYFAAGVDAPNGFSSLGALDVLVNPSASFPGGCAITYDFASGAARLLDGSGLPGTAKLTVGQGGSFNNSICSFAGLSDYRPEAGFAQVSFSLLPLVQFDAGRKVFYRLRHQAEAVPGNWIEIGALSVVGAGDCGVSVSPPVSQVYGDGQTSSAFLSAASSCAWQATTGADWVRVQPISGSGSVNVTITVAANPTTALRETTIRFNQFSYQLRQYPKGDFTSPYLRFTQSELDVDRTASKTTLQFQTNWPEDPIQWLIDAPWLRVTGYRLAVAGCPCVDIAWDGNLTQYRRRGAITAPSGATLHVVQDPGGLQPGDYNLTTFAGSDTAPEGQNPLTAVIKRPVALAVDSAGSVFFAEEMAGRVRKVTPDGHVVTVAGLGYNSYANSTGQALQAGISSPQGIAVDGKHNLYIADYNMLVRVVAPDGLVKILAGNGQYGYAGDGGPATSAQFRVPSGIAVANDGTVYVSDSFNHCIRKITPDGKIATVAGNGSSGFAGDNGPANKAQLNEPRGLAFDLQGALLIADAGNHRVRRLSPDGNIATIAGTGTPGSAGDGALATSAMLYRPCDLSVDAAGNIYVAEQYNYRIRRIAPDGKIATVVGGAYGDSGDGGPPAAALLSGVRAVAALPNGDLYIADSDNYRVRFVQGGRIATFAGLGTRAALGDGGTALSATFFGPGGLTVDAAGNVYVADTENHRVRKIVTDGKVSTFVGTGQAGIGIDGKPAASTPIYRPIGLAFDKSGALYLTTSCIIRKVGLDGVLTAFAGSSCGYDGDGGPAAKARFSSLGGLAFDPQGNLYVADQGNQRVRKIAPDGTVTLVAGTGEYGSSGDGGPAKAAQFRNPRDVAVDASGNLYIADTYNYRIRRIDTQGNISTAVGSSYGYSGDRGPAAGAQIGLPQAVKIDAGGNIWIADAGFHVVRRIASADGSITTVAGTGSQGFSGEQAPGWTALLNGPSAVAPAGNDVLIADTGNDRIRRLTPAGASTVPAPGSPSWTITKTHSGAFSQGQNGATYTIAVVNTGTAATNGQVTVTENPPGGLTLVSMSGQNWTCPANTNTCSRNDALGAGANYSSITVTVNVSASAPGSVNNQATVSGGGAALQTTIDPTTISPIAGSMPGVVSLNPAVSMGSSQTFTFQFSHTAGWQALGVVNVLINTALDGLQSCYLAYSVPDKVLYLVPDSGARLLPGLALNGAGGTGNSQCAIAGAGSSASGSGNVLTLTLSVTFNGSFGGNKVVYMAARDPQGNNTGWNLIGVHAVPPLPSTFPTPVGMSPSSGNTLTQTIAFTWRDQSAAANLQTVWALINTALDARTACYVAYYRPGNQVFLFPDNGDGAQATNIVLTGNNTIGNSQCTVSAQGASVQTSGNTLTVSLPITFKTAFAGFKGVWMAAYTLGGASSPWQALGAVTVPAQ